MKKERNAVTENNLKVFYSFKWETNIVKIQIKCFIDFYDSTLLNPVLPI